MILKKALKLPSRDSIFSAVKGMIIRYLLKAVTSALASADFIQAKEELKGDRTTPTLTLNFLSIIGVEPKKNLFFAKPHP